MEFYRLRACCLWALLYLACLLSAEATKVYSVDYESQADVKVFVVEYQSQADLLVYRVQYESQVRRTRWLRGRSEDQEWSEIIRAISRVGI